MSLIAPPPGKGTAGALAARRPGHGARFWPRVPPNFFGIPFGLAGLAEAWHAASPTLGTWLSLRRPAGAAGCAIVIIAVITALIGVITVRTMILLLRGQLLVRPSAPANP